MPQFFSIILQYHISLLLTVRFPKFLTLQTKCTVLPTKPVTFDIADVSKYGPVPGVGKSCKNSVRNFRDVPAKAPASREQEKVQIELVIRLSCGFHWFGCVSRRKKISHYRIRNERALLSSKGRKLKLLPFFHSLSHLTPIIVIIIYVRHVM